MPFLTPSEIYYSSKDISERYGSFWDKVQIGEYLDDICNDRRFISDLPMLRVNRPLGRMLGRWVTKDNDTLWIYKQLEKNGKCTSIHVEEVGSILSLLSFSPNRIIGTVHAEVKGEPGGHMYKEDGFLDGIRQCRSAIYECFIVLFILCFFIIFLYYMFA